ncbi:fusaric acid resistance protein [Chimaeribacter californicus]|uniref:Fusaric acid resistance protein n=1 Tax=Chimaeribacter californicus TaxID=2060067 RepID=A0A2N5EGC9_9GAMM|nr:FUSC family protein [Chimaeribacter californicus]PLR41603.1 fusaric acid resistance protein [Chimaeribacter californicus]
MKLSWPAWPRTPWGKATSGQWRYALRNSLAMALALWVAFYLQLDQPTWALTSAAVVSFPTVGGVISKSLGRIAGSLLGAAASILIAGHCLNDPWLFTLVIAAWIGGCTFVSNHYQNNVSYAFALAGYTAAIIAFSTVNITDTQDIWNLAQARVCEVITGILCGGLMMMILPSTSDGSTLLTSLRTLHTRLLEHAAMLWQPEVSPRIRTSHEGVISQILTLNLLRIQAFWSHYRFRRQNRTINFLLHQQLTLTSVISSVRRMLLNWPSPPENLPAILERLLTQLAQPHSTPYELAKTLHALAPAGDADFRHRALWLRLHHFCRLYLQSERWLRRVETAGPVTTLSPPATRRLARHTDSYEAAYNGLRTFLCIVIGCAYWITTQWDAGSAGLTLVAISCVLYSSTPSPINSITTLLKAMVLLSVSTYLIKFGLMVQIGDLWVFSCFLLPVLITMQLVKLQNARYAALWGQLIVFSGSFLSIANPPEYDYQAFINDSLAKLAGVMLAGLAFQVLKPSSDKRKSRRLIRALRRDFIDQLNARPQRSQSDFESLIYHRISQLNQGKDEVSRIWLLRWGVVLLNCAQVVWQLRDWQTRSDPLAAVRDRSLYHLKGIMTERGVNHAALTESLNELQRMCDALARHPDPAARDLAGVIWRLASSLSQLQQAVPAPDSAMLKPA